MHQKDLETFDFRSSYLVLGSGLSAISVISGILDNDSTNKIYVIDAGITQENQSNIDVSFKEKKINIPSPKFITKNNKFAYNYFTKLNKISKENFIPIGSLAKGGLSNIWGATIQPYNNHELKNYPYKLDKEINTIYLKILNILKGNKSNFKEIDNLLEASVASFSTRKPILAINKINSNNKNCLLNSCDTGCINCNKDIFSSKYFLDKLINSNKIKYFNNFFIKKISKKGENYYLECLNLETNKNFRIIGNKIFCSLGVLATSKIVIDMHKNENELPLLTTPGGAFMLFSTKNSYDKNFKILSNSSFSGKKEEIEFNGNIFPFSKNLLANYLGNEITEILFFIFGRILFSKIYIANVYFSSEFSDTKIIKNKDGIKIIASDDNSFSKVFKSCINLIKVGLKKDNFLMIPFIYKIFKPGSDIHYAGSLPIKKSPKVLECDKFGELKGHENFFISDASSMPSLPGKGHSFNMMVNSYYIGMKNIFKDN